MSLKKVSYEAFVLSVFSRIRKTRSHWPGGQSALRFYNCYNLYPSYCARQALVGECWPGPEFKFSKTVEVGWSCQNLQLCQRTISTAKIQEKKNWLRAQQYKNRAYWLAQCHALPPLPRTMARGSREFQHLAGIKPLEPKSPDSLRLTLTAKP